MKNKRIFLAILSVLLIVALTGCSGSGEFGSFTASTLDGGSFSGKDMGKKDLTVINFWGTFCSPCIAEMPDLAAFEKALPDNVQLITVCVDAEGNEETAKEILNYAGYEGITLVDGDDSFKEMLKVAQAIPITIFIGPDGEQIGEGILGMQQDLKGAYLSAINSALKELGKAEISLEK